MTTEVYRREVEKALPRLLGSFDRDPLSPARGLGDRLFWAWKLIDFPNAAFQGAAHGLARLVAADLLPSWLPEASVLDRVLEMVSGVRRVTRRNGSVEEAFPHESSFCVTALVAFDLLVALALLRPRLTQTQANDCLEAVAPLVRFLHRSDEAHGFISNHLATAAAALYRWSAQTGEPGAARGELFLQRILRHQSAEGWFPEYEGCDPGYQTLCTCYLVDLHRLRPELALGDPLARSIRLLARFAHPDGSFGGGYGSRNTRFYYPAAAEALAEEFADAAALARFMRRSIGDLRVVTLASMDPPNLAPMFNAYCWAAAEAQARSGAPIAHHSPLPCELRSPERLWLPEARLLIDRGPRHYTVISVAKGGVCYHFRDNRAAVIDTGAVARDRGGKLFSTQDLRMDNAFTLVDNVAQIIAPFAPLRARLPRPFQFVLLRLLSATVMRSLWVGTQIKIMLARLLIKPSRPSRLWNQRRIRLGPDLTVDDSFHGHSRGFQRLRPSRPFSAIHMASQGYWQRQDDEQP